MVVNEWNALDENIINDSHWQVSSKMLIIIWVSSAPFEFLSLLSLTIILIVNDVQVQVQVFLVAGFVTETTKEYDFATRRIFTLNWCILSGKGG